MPKRVSIGRLQNAVRFDKLYLTYDGYVQRFCRLYLSISGTEIISMAEELFQIFEKQISQDILKYKLTLRRDYEFAIEPLLEMKRHCISHFQNMQLKR